MNDQEFATEIKALKRDGDAVLVRIDRLIEAALERSINGRLHSHFRTKRKVKA